jgi:hypothetical protein
MSVNLQKMNPQSKMISVNDRLGNPFIKEMQGTTKMIYDTLPIDGRDVYQFFLDTSTRQFPFCNVKNTGLQPGESLAIQRVSFIKFNATLANGNYTIVSYIGLEGLTTTELPLVFSDLSISIANETVMKPIPIQHFLPEYNKNSGSAINEVFEMNTNLMIPPQLEFSFDLRAPIHATNATTGFDFLRIVVEGVGSQFNSKGNF